MTSTPVPADPTDALHTCAYTRIGDLAAFFHGDVPALGVRASWLDATDAAWLAVDAGRDASLLAPVAALRAAPLRRNHWGRYRTLRLADWDAQGRIGDVLRFLRRLSVATFALGTADDDYLGESP